MVGNMYGVDIKVTPTRKGPAAKGIELNGVNSGTDFFKYEEGAKYYRDFARRVGAKTKGRPLFFRASPCLPPDTIERACWRREYAEKRDERKKDADTIRKVVPKDVPLETAWIDDKYDFDCAYIDREPEHEEFHYALGAQAEGIPAYLYDKVSYKRDHLDFTLHNGGRLRIRPSDVGAIRSELDWQKAPKHLKHLFFNTGINELTTSIVEEVTDSKLLFYFTTTFREKDQDIWPEHIYYGLGGTTPAQMRAFIRRTKADRYVRKYSASSCGVGVDIMTKEELRKQLPRKRRAAGSLEDAGLLLEMVNNAHWNDTLDGYVSVFQPFIPSIPIPHPRTGAPHDGCARMIVLSLDNEAPVVVGGQWRLAPRPMDDKSAPAAERLRANLSRGATAVPMDDEAYRLASDCAIKIVNDYETFMWPCHQVLEIQQEKYKTKGFKHLPRKIDIFRGIFYENYLCAFSEQHGFRWYDEITASGVKAKMHHK
jgi:hypothetical protein